jgi:hypothetical protein
MEDDGTSIVSSERGPVCLQRLRKNEEPSTRYPIQDEGRVIVAVEQANNCVTRKDTA